MKVSQINNYAPSSKARLPQKEVQGLINTVKDSGKAEELPKLYTLLDLLDKTSGKVASFNTETITGKFRALGRNGSKYPSKIYHTLYIDNVEVRKGTGSKLDVLKSAMTDYKTKEGNFISMPESVFDQMWWKNRDKTISDVKELVLLI